jgi:outer membrane protein TolC
MRFPFLLLAFLFAGGVVARGSAVDSARRAVEKTLEKTLRREVGLPSVDSAPRPIPAGAVDLYEAVRLGLANNPELERRREELRLSALSVDLSVHEFEPQLRGTIQALGTQTAVQPPGENAYRTTVERLRGTTTFGVEQNLPWGGSLSIDGGAVAARTEGDPWTVAPSAAVELSQPLLRGAGIEYNFERITRSKQALLYGLRGFKIQRERFAISVMRTFLDILDTDRSIAIRERTLAEHEKVLKLSEVLAGTGAVSQVDVLRARREAIADRIAIGNLNLRKTTLLDQFKLVIGFPEDQPLALAPYNPDVEPVREDPAVAVEAALRNRVDLKTAEDAVADAERAIRRAGNEMLPDLRVAGRAAIRSTDTNSSSGWVYEDYSAVITLDLPFERQNERFSLFNASQQLIRSKRDLEFAADSIAVAVRSILEQLAWIEESIGYHDELYEVDMARYRRALEEFKTGKRSNRDAIDALVSLLFVAGTRDSLRSEHFINSVRLRQETGLFDVDGMIVAKQTP